MGELKVVRGFLTAQEIGRVMLFKVTCIYLFLATPCPHGKPHENKDCPELAQHTVGPTYILESRAYHTDDLEYLFWP